MDLFCSKMGRKHLPKTYMQMGVFFLNKGGSAGFFGHRENDGVHVTVGNPML